MGILSDCLRKAALAGADRIEIEYKDRRELIMAFRGNLGFGLGSVDSSKRGTLLRELERLREARQIKPKGRTYGLRLSEYESFGETVHVIGIQEIGGSK
jgi:hypothetical protein